MNGKRLFNYREKYKYANGRKKGIFSPDFCFDNRNADPRTEFLPDDSELRMELSIHSIYAPKKRVCETKTLPTIN